MKLGVTGGIGSGKSVVCGMLEDLGARVFYADNVGKRILAEDEGAREEVIEAFGEASYRNDGSLNRGYLAERIFSNDDELEVLNQIVHPRVFAAFQEEKERAERDGVDLLVHEAALIFESGGDEHLDAVAVVDAPEADRIRRVMERDGVSEEEVRARMANQLPPEELRQRANYVIDNSGTLEDLRGEVEQLFHRVTEQPSQS